MNSRRYLVILLALLGGACGVKGVPQAPAKPVVMSHGYPNFAKVNEDLEAKRKKTARPLKDDFEDEEDFPEDSSKQ